MQKEPSMKVLPVKCENRIVARVAYWEDMIFIVNEASGNVIKLVPPTGMVFSAPSVFTIYVEPKERIINSLRRAGISLTSGDKQWKTMKEMAVEYRLAASRLSMKIKQMKNDGAPELEIRELRTALRDIRSSERVLASYYDAPRPETGGAAVGWVASRVQNWDWHKKPK